MISLVNRKSNLYLFKIIIYLCLDVQLIKPTETIGNIMQDWELGGEKLYKFVFKKAIGENATHYCNIPNQIENQIGNQIENQIENQNENQIGNQIENQNENQIKNQIENRNGNANENKNKNKNQINYCTIIKSREDLIKKLLDSKIQDESMLQILFKNTNLLDETIYSDFKLTYECFKIASANKKPEELINDNKINFIRKILIESKTNIRNEFGFFRDEFWEIVDKVLKKTEIDCVLLPEINKDYRKLIDENFKKMVDHTLELCLLPRQPTDLLKEKLKLLEPKIQHSIIQGLLNCKNEQKDLALWIDKAVTNQTDELTEIIIEELRPIVIYYETHLKEILANFSLQHNERLTCLTLNEKIKDRYSTISMKTIDYLAPYLNVPTTSIVSILFSNKGISETTVSGIIELVKASQGLVSPFELSKNGIDIILKIALKISEYYVAFFNSKVKRNAAVAKILEFSSTGEYPELVKCISRTIMNEIAYNQSEIILEAMRNDVKDNVEHLCKKVTDQCLDYANNLQITIENEKQSKNYNKIFTYLQISKWMKEDSNFKVIDCNVEIENELKNICEESLKYLEIEKKQDRKKLEDLWKGNSTCDLMIKYVLDFGTKFVLSPIIAQRKLSFNGTVRDSELIEKFAISAFLSRDIFSENTAKELKIGSMKIEPILVNYSYDRELKCGIYKIEKEEVVKKDEREPKQEVKKEGSKTITVIVFGVLQNVSKVIHWSANSYGTDSLEEYNNQKVHEGFHSFFSTRINELEDVFQTISKENNSIIVTGHGVNGAFAQLFYLKIKKEIPNLPISVFTFGTPFILFEKHLNCADIHNCINSYDLIPRILGNKSIIDIINTLGNIIGYDTCKIITENVQIENFKPIGKYYWLTNGKFVETVDISNLLYLNPAKCYSWIPDNSIEKYVNHLFDQHIPQSKENEQLSN